MVVGQSLAALSPFWPDNSKGSALRFRLRHAHLCRVDDRSRRSIEALHALRRSAPRERAVLSISGLLHASHGHADRLTHCLGRRRTVLGKGKGAGQRVNLHSTDIQATAMRMDSLVSFVGGIEDRVFGCAEQGTTMICPLV